MRTLVTAAAAGESLSLSMQDMVRLRQEHPGRGAIVITQNIGRNIPKVMFVLLPLFALYISLFYNRKKYLYAQHIIFSLHFHSFIFIAFLLEMLATWPFTSLWPLVGITVAILLLIFVYLGLALARAYEQTRWLSFGKAFAICTLYLVTLLASIILVGFISFMKA
jgi:hypothetical protein